MKNKLKLWEDHQTWDEAENDWEVGCATAAEHHPIKTLKQLPNMIGITPDTAKNLKWKSLRWMVKEDHQGIILKNFLKHPLKYGWSFIKSVMKKNSFKRDGDFFLYGIESLKELEEEIRNPDNLFVLGFSYCHKPFECPSGRFTPDCIHDPDHLVCRQCFIGKAFNAAPIENTVPLCIPTIHYIGEKIFDCVHQNPGKKIIFMITACEMTLKMFGDWGNMVEIKGIGVRLDGRICNTMQAFELSEKGIKPGLTVILDETRKKFLDFIRLRREAC